MSPPTSPNPELKDQSMTRNEYIDKLRTIYMEANNSDTDDRSVRPEWMHGDESRIHCQALEIIVRDMQLPDGWYEQDFDMDKWECETALEEFRTNRENERIAARLDL